VVKLISIIELKNNTITYKLKIALNFEKIIKLIVIIIVNDTVRIKYKYLIIYFYAL